MRVPLLLATLGFAACAEPADRSTDWSYLHATIIEPYCATAGCHSSLSAQGGPAFATEVDLSDADDAYFDLTGIDCGSSAPLGNYVGLDGTVVPLIQLLRGEPWEFRDMNDPEYVQMPVDTPLAPAEIALIEQWIEAGAPCE